MQQMKNMKKKEHLLHILVQIQIATGLKEFLNPIKQKNKMKTNIIILIFLLLSGISWSQENVTSLKTKMNSDIQNGDYRSVLKSGIKVLKVEPDNWQINYAMAVSNQKLFEENQQNNTFQDAVSYFKKTIEFNKDLADSYYYFGLLYYSRAEILISKMNEHYKDEDQRIFFNYKAQMENDLFQADNHFLSASKIDKNYKDVKSKRKNISKKIKSDYYNVLLKNIDSFDDPLINTGEIGDLYLELQRILKTQKNVAKFIDSKTTYLYDIETERFEPALWIGKINDDHIYPEGSGIAFFINGNVYVGSTFLGNIHGPGKFFTSVKKNGESSLNSTRTNFTGITSEIRESNFYYNKMVGPSYIRLYDRSDQQYLIIAGNWNDNKLINQGIGYLSVSNALESFGEKCYNCSQKGNTQIQCDLTEEMEAKIIMRERLAAAAIVGIGVLIKKGFDSWRKGMSTQMNSSKSGNNSSDPPISMSEPQYIKIGDWTKVNSNWSNFSIPYDSDYSRQVKFKCPIESVIVGVKTTYIGRTKDSKYSTGTNICTEKGLNRELKFKTFEEALQRTIECTCDPKY